MPGWGLHSLDADCNTCTPASSPSPRHGLPCAALPALPARFADFAKIARATAGFTGAELMNLMNQSGGKLAHAAANRVASSCMQASKVSEPKQPNSQAGW